VAVFRTCRFPSETCDTVTTRAQKTEIRRGVGELENRCGEGNGFPRRSHNFCGMTGLKFQVSHLQRYLASGVGEGARAPERRGRPCFTRERLSIWISDATRYRLRSAQTGCKA
jgi:hypothetical protein